MPYFTIDTSTDVEIDVTAKELTGRPYLVLDWGTDATIWLSIAESVDLVAAVVAVLAELEQPPEREIRRDAAVVDADVAAREAL